MNWQNRLTTKSRWLLGLGTCVALPCGAQEILNSPQGRIDTLLAPPAAPERATDSFLQLGDFEMNASASLGVSYSDNIAYASKPKREDLIISPGLSLGAFWPLSERNTLRFSLLANYEKYIDHSDFDRFSVSPGSELSLNALVGEFRFHVYDSAWFSLDPFQVGSVSGEREYGGLRNSAGLSVSKDLNLCLLSLGYDRFDFFSTTGSSDPEARATDSIFARAPFRLGETVVLGPEAGVSWTHYREDYHSDHTSYSAGLFANWPVTEFLTLTPRAGVAYYDFSGGGQLPTSDSSSFYADLAVSHRLSKYLRHQVAGGRRQQLGVYSDLLDTYFANYSFSWDAMEGLGVSIHVGWEHGNDSASNLGEVYDRVWVGPSVSKRLAEKLTATLGYRYVTKMSDRDPLDYEQNLVTLSVSYRF
jgi:hypothetical protein